MPQAAETDARFLRRLAAREEFEFFIDDSGFHWRPRNQASPPTHVLTWYSDPGRGDVMSLLDKEVFFFTTFGGEALSLAAAKATLEEMRARPVHATIAAQGKKLRGAGFKQWLLETACLGMDDQHQAISDRFRNWKGDEEQVDDVLLIGVEL